MGQAMYSQSQPGADAAGGPGAPGAGGAAGGADNVVDAEFKDSDDSSPKP